MKTLQFPYFSIFLIYLHGKNFQHLVLGTIYFEWPQQLVIGAQPYCQTRLSNFLV